MSVSRIDAGPGAVSLEGSWQELNTPGAFADTVISPSSTGARLNYDFTGTSIVVYGTTLPSTIAQSNAICRFYIDDSLVTVQSFTLQDTRQNNVLLFRSSNLPAGSHRLTIQNDSPRSNNAIAIDYFEIADQGRPLISSPPLSISSPSSSPSPTSSSPRGITASSDPSSSDASSSTTNSTSSSGSLTPSLTESETPSLPSGMDPNHPSFSLYVAFKRSSSVEDALPTGASATERHAGRSGPHLGPIIGGAIGGLALVFLVILLAIYLRKRRRDRKDVSVIGILGDHISSRSPSPRRSNTHNLLSSFSGSATAPPLQTSCLSEKQGLSSSSTESGSELSPNESELSPPSPPASHARDVRSANRHTAQSIQTTLTATTALPRYELQLSSQASPSVRPEAPPAYQV